MSDRLPRLDFTRRNILLTAGLGLIAAGAAPGLAWAAGTPAWAARGLSSVQAATLTAVAELIMPATETPGAIAAGVPQFVDRALVDYLERDMADLLRGGLDGLEATAQGRYGAAFARLPAGRQTELLAALEREQSDRADSFFNTLRSLVTVGYFTSEIGATQALRYDPVPGESRGCIPLAPTDRAWAM